MSTTQCVMRRLGSAFHFVCTHLLFDGLLDRERVLLLLCFFFLQHTRWYTACHTLNKHNDLHMAHILQLHVEGGGVE